MKRGTTIFIAVIVVLLVCIGIVIFLLATRSSNTAQGSGQSNSNTQNGFPLAGSTSSSSSQTNLISVKAADGTTLLVSDFMHNGETVADTNDPGTYELAGSLGYCLPNGTCPSGASTTDFDISYEQDTQFFDVTLLSEPLNTAREEAQQFLASRLGLPEAELCNLNYSVGTIASVNPVYSGEELKFSVCPGAVPLPQ